MAIELKNVSFRYESSGYVAVENVSMVIHPGEKVAIVGQNGAGKTTTVKMMNGIHKPFAGDVIVDGINTKNVSTATMAKHVGYVFQNPDDQIFNSSVLGEIQYMLKRVKMSQEEIQRRTEKALRMTHLEALRDSNPYELPLPFRKFLTIAAVIAAEPKYIILDEPTAGQDTKGNRILKEIIDALSAEGVGVITISHDMEFVADNFDRVIAMAHKNVIMDAGMREVFWTPEIVEESRISMPELCRIADELGFGKERIVFIDELVNRLADHGGEKML